MRGAVPPLLQYAIMAWCSVKAEGQIYLYLCKYCKSFEISHAHQSNMFVIEK